MIQLLNRRMFLGAASGEEAGESNYLTFEAIESGTFKFSRNAISYSMDGGKTWANLPANTATPTVAAGQKICFKASGLTVSTTYGIGTFSATADFNASGNIMSMQDGDNFGGSLTINNTYQFRRLFYENAHLIRADGLALPATTLKTSCYREMFASCSALITAPPVLPATTLASSCYYYMFYVCPSLVTAPVLPAPTLVDSCYYAMFYDTKVNYVKCLATSIGAYNCLYVWLYSVPSSGTFVKASGVSWPTGYNGIPSGWTVQNA